LWVPVGVEQNDDVGSCKVDAETTGTSTQHEDELGAARSIVVVD